MILPNNRSTVLDRHVLCHRCRRLHDQRPHHWLPCPASHRNGRRNSVHARVKRGQQRTSSHAGLLGAGSSRPVRRRRRPWRPSHHRSPFPLQLAKRKLQSVWKYGSKYSLMRTSPAWCNPILPIPVQYSDLLHCCKTPILSYCTTFLAWQSCELP